jgi:hypothetical protein
MGHHRCNVTHVTDHTDRFTSFCIMAFKDTQLYSIVTFSCPYCHEGRFFVSHPYDLSHAGDLLESCPRCGRRYSIEPGFYYGAMYVAYAIGVAVCVSTWVAIMVLRPDTGLLAQILSICGIMILGTPLFYALSKIIWANMFLPYKGSASREADR